MNAETLDRHIADIRALMRSNLRMRGATFEAQVKRAGRLLPRAVRRDAAQLIAARKLMENPKLARMVDPAQLTKAHANIITHLKTIDPAERRKDRILGFLGIIAFNILLMAGLFIAWLVWTDRV